MKKITPLFVFLFLFSFLTNSQTYLEMIDSGSFSVEEIISEANQYFADKDKGRGSGYKQFKRWEYMAKKMMNEEGYLTPFEDRLAQLEEYNAYLNATSQNRMVLNDNWEELGPTDWNATTAWSPGVGRVTGIAIDPTNANHIIVGANTGGVWKTTDGGQTWTPLGDYFSNLYVYSVTIDPQDSSTYYFGSSSGLIYKSTDGGATWMQLADVSNSLINKILIHPTDSNIIFVSSQNAGMYVSTDGGVTWNHPISDSKCYDIEFKPGDPTVVYVSGSGFHKSIDGGNSFTTISGFTNEAKMMGVSPDDASVVYVVEANGGSFGGFYKSTDSGDSFTQLDHTGRNYFGYDTAGYQSGGQAPRDMDIAVNPTNVNEVHIAGVLTWRSMDGGVNFSISSDWIPQQAQSSNIGYCHADVDILVFDGTTLFVGTDGGIFKAENTGTINSTYYTDITAGIGIRQFYKIGISQTADVVVTGGSQDNGSSFYTLAGGWKDWIGADGMEGLVDKNNTNIMFGMIQFGDLYRTTNGANSIQYISTPGGGSGSWVTPFEQDPIVQNTIYTGYTRVYKSTNLGASWTVISQNFGGNLNNLKIAPSNNQVMYASRSGLLYKTEDGGATNWIQMTSPGGIINSIAVFPTNPNKIAVATTSSNKVFVSEDGGQTWQNYKLNLPDFSAQCVLWDNNGNEGLYLGMDYGIFYIDNSFTEWQPFSNNLPNVIIAELEINKEDGKIYAGTYGRGLWASPAVPTVLGIQDFGLSKSIYFYPNPVIDKLVISSKNQLEGAIRVFDVTGKLLKYLPAESIGTNYTLNVSDLNTGIYFVRINSAKGYITQKIIKK